MEYGKFKKAKELIKLIAEAEKEHKHHAEMAAKHENLRNTLRHRKERLEEELKHTLWTNLQGKCKEIHFMVEGKLYKVTYSTGKTKVQEIQV